MKAHQKKELFERECKAKESNILKFEGVEGFDVYNCSQPFIYKNKQYLYGRVERRSEWMRSWVQLFEEVDINHWKRVENSMIYQLEDPYITKIDEHYVMGGTHVQVAREDELRAYFGYFYYGKELENLKYFTTGPKNMKDIRLVQLKDVRIGVFSRPRSKELIEKYGSESLIGFTIINSLDELTAEVISNATIIPGLFGDLEWGGVNQAYLLGSGDIGVIGHLSYQDGDQSVYTVMSFVLDYENLKVHDYKIIATRKSFPEGPAKRDHLHDCCFPSGIVPIEGTDDCLLYSGIGDTQEGVVKISYPFKKYGRMEC
jgi:hypothetical protein